MTRNEAKKIRANIEKTATFADDKTALESLWMYPRWVADVTYEAGQRLAHGGKLYRVIMPHTSQADWAPDVAMTLYERIDEVHDGSQYDPVPYDGNMALENGKYYIQNNIVYHCIRDTGVPVYNALADLVGIYVREVQ
jgi:hypothetical protein